MTDFRQILQLNLENLARMQENSGGPAYRRELRNKHEARKAIEADIRRICDLVSLVNETTLTWDQIKGHLEPSKILQFKALVSLPDNLVDAWERSRDNGVGA